MNEQAKYTTFRVDHPLRDRLRTLKEQLHFQTYNSLLNYLLLEQAKSKVSMTATFDVVFRDSLPIVLTGKSGSGKTTCMKSLLSQYSNSVFLIDVSDEYKSLEQLRNLGEFFQIDWTRKNGKVRIIPNTNLEVSKAEASSIFSHLNMIKNSGVLKDWCIVVEEAHRFSSDSNLRTLLLEARKFIRKLIVVTADYEIYQDIAQQVKPA